MSQTFRIREGDQLPALEWDWFDANGAANLAGASSPKFYMVDVTGTSKVDGSAATISSSVPGRTRYSWASGDTDTPGVYRAWFEVTINSKTLTNPSGYITVIVEAA